MAAGLAYALAPRMLSELFSISAELLPVAVLPWVLVPLVRASAERGGSPRRAAARSGVALLFAGGINASATLAILPAPALFLLTRARGPAPGGADPLVAAVGAAGLPVVADPAAGAGQVQPAVPGLDRERGGDHHADLADREPARGRPTGWPISARPAGRPAGCWWWRRRRSWPPAWWPRSAWPASPRADRNRLFLVGCLLLGLVLVTLGHRGPLGPPFAGQWQQLLDGPANAFRNVHKFDPLVRLPLALGAGAAAGLVSILRAGGLAPLAARPAPADGLPAMALLAMGAVAVGAGLRWPDDRPAPPGRRSGPGGRRRQPPGRQLRRWPGAGSAWGPAGPIWCGVRRSTIRCSRWPARRGPSGTGCH